MPLSYKNIEPLIISGKNIFSKWIGYFGLGIGVLVAFGFHANVCKHSAIAERK